MKLELSSLENAIASLDRSIRAADAHAHALPKDLIETVRSGIIQNFEVAYELSWKMIMRWLKTNRSPAAVDVVTRRELFRLAAESGLISNVSDWMDFHVARNETSRTYDHKTAEEVFARAREFPAAAQRLLTTLHKHND